MDAPLAQRCQTEFNRVDRERGDLYQCSGAVHIESLGTLGVRALVRGSDNNYEVLIDLREIDDHILCVHCECPRYDSGYLCKHIWATILELDRIYQFPVAGRKNIEVFEVEPDEVEIGPPMPLIRGNIAGNGHAGNGISLNSNALGGAGDWQQRLRLARRFVPAKTAAAVPPPQPQQPRQSMRHRFVISLADQINLPNWNLVLMRCTQRDDGSWSEPKPVQIGEAEVAVLEDDQERRIFAMLQWERDFAYDRAARRIPATKVSRFRMHPYLVRETLEQLCADDRLAWTMDAKQPGAELTPIGQETGPAWDFAVLLAPATPTGSKPKGGRRVQESTPMLAVQPMLQRGEGDAKEQRPIERVMSVCNTGAILMDDGIGTVNPSDAPWIRGWQQVGSMELPAEELGSFLEAFVSTESPPRLEIDEALGVTMGPGRPQPKLTLSAPDDPRANQLVAKVSMRYGSREFGEADQQAVTWDGENRQLLYRDRAAESAAEEDLREYQFRECYVRYNLTEVRIDRRWFTQLVSELTAKDWEVVAEGKLMRSAGSFHIEVASGEDWFDLQASADFDGMQAALPTLLQALKKGESFVVLDDGTHGMLPEDWLKQFSGFAQAGQIEGDSLRYQRNQALLLDMMLAEQEGVKTDRTFNAWCDRLRSFSGIKPSKEPRGFQGTLREYQKDGLGWFHFLRDFEFGGCLADDMGLGKTIQVLALLQSRRLARRKDGGPRKPSIALVPKSLIFNWIAEAEKFAPRLKVVDYTGLDRAERLDELKSADLVLTTYGTLRRDVAQLKEIAYDYAILDEAQAIKNPKSQAAKATRLIPADYRLAMTGTPVENHLGDLWSLLDFLNPGMLGQMSVANFSNGEATGERISGLNTALRPFILRRTKEQVLTELPEKSEQTLYCDMTPKQRKLYDELRAHYRSHLSGKVKELGIKRAKIHVLEALLRLRQAACDPRLVNKKQGAPGAKVARLLEQLQEVTSEGHKALVFSQFTSLLALVRKELDKQGIAYEYLDGKTNKRNEHVRRFQEDPDCPVFLISLKAGGHGLNLTAADYVYILDPWWNPAVEAQAIDRAHRMGQTKPVIAYRLICRDTVEEKIVHLQQSKRELADAIISADGSLISRLSMDDLQILFG